MMDFVLEAWVSEALAPRLRHNSDGGSSALNGERNGYTSTRLA